MSKNNKKMKIFDETRFTVAYVGVCYIILMFFPDIYEYIGVGLAMIASFLFFMWIYFRILEMYGKRELENERK